MLKSKYENTESGRAHTRGADGGDGGDSDLARAAGEEGGTTRGGKRTVPSLRLAARGAREAPESGPERKSVG